MQLQTTIGHQIRIARVAKGMQQKDLAEATGLKRTIISLIETGRVNPTDDELAKIRAILDGWSEEIEPAVRALAPQQ